jgi:VWFA-related protein
MRLPSIVVGVLLAGTAIGGMAGVRASDRTPAPDATAPPLIERVTTELVLIEVYVTDPAGHPMPGLTTDDFVLEVDGHRRPIATTEYHTVAAAGPPPAAVGSTAAPPAGAPAPGAGESSTPQSRVADWPRRFVLFFEDDTSAVQGMTQARRASERFLSSGLTPSDQVAVVAYGHGLKVLHDFTTDREALRSAIAQTLDGVERYSDFAADENEALQAWSRGTPSFGAGNGAAIATSICLQQKRRLSAVVSALSSLVDSLAPWRGQKAIVFMGEGVPDTPTGALFDELLKTRGADAAAGAGRCTMELELKRLNESAAAAGVVLDSIQTSGLTAERGFAASRAARRANALRTLALNTGGLASDSNDIAAALSQVEQASRSYYVLGYAPEGAPDGQYHSVVVRCRQRRTHLRWRHGFTRLPPAEARARAIQAAHLLPELYDELGIEAAAVAGPRKGGERAVDLVVHVPAHRLLFLPEAGQPTARLEIGFVGMDESLHETLRISRRLKVTLSGRAAGSDPLSVTLYTRCLLPAGRQSITAVVYDEAGGSVGGERLEIPAAPAQSTPVGATTSVLGLSLYSLSEASLWVEVPAAAAGPAEGEATATGEIGPALKDAFDPAEEIACGFRVGGATDSGDVPLRLEIRHDNEVVRMRSVEASAGGRSVKVSLPTAGLSSGSYDLVVLRAAAPPVEMARTPFRIR